MIALFNHRVSKNRLASFLLTVLLSLSGLASLQAVQFSVTPLTPVVTKSQSTATFSVSIDPESSTVEGWEFGILFPQGVTLATNGITEIASFPPPQSGPLAQVASTGGTGIVSNVIISTTPISGNKVEIFQFTVNLPSGSQDGDSLPFNFSDQLDSVGIFFRQNGGVVAPATVSNTVLAISEVVFSLQPVGTVNSTQTKATLAFLVSTADVQINGWSGGIAFPSGVTTDTITKTGSLTRNNGGPALFDKVADAVGGGTGITFSTVINTSSPVPFASATPVEMFRFTVNLPTGIKDGDTFPFSVSSALQDSVGAVATNYLKGGMTFPPLVTGTTLTIDDTKIRQQAALTAQLQRLQKQLIRTNRQLRKVRKSDNRRKIRSVTRKKKRLQRQLRALGKLR